MKVIVNDKYLKFIIMTNKVLIIKKTNPVILLSL